LRPAVRSRARLDCPALPAASWSSGHPVSSDGSRRGGSGGAAGSPLPRPGVAGERGRPPTRAGAGLSRHRAARDRRLAHRLPPAWDCLPSCDDRSAVRHGVAPPHVSFLHPLALVGLVAAAIPALLHLLHRRTPPELEFPPVRYLSDAERRSARR